MTGGTREVVSEAAVLSLGGRARFHPDDATKT